MTDRYNTLTVVLENNTRDDDAEATIAAILQIKGVLTVAGNVADPTSFMAEERAKSDLGRKLLNVIYPDQFKA